MKNHLLFGVGVNDSVDKLSGHITLDGKCVPVWRCPAYAKWVFMLERCYSEKYLAEKPSYRGCFVCPEWLFFSEFKAWFMSQQYEGKHLDKDLLVLGNKEYSPERCLLVSAGVNSFMTEVKSNIGDYPTGVCLKKATGKYTTYVNNPLTGMKLQIGTYSTPEEARLNYLRVKLEIARELSYQQENPVIAEALIRRYECMYESFLEQSGMVGVGISPRVYMKGEFGKSGGVSGGVVSTTYSFGR